MASRPQVKEGTGEKPQFKDLKLELKSHKESEFETDTNKFDIEIKASRKIKTIFNLFRFDASGQEEKVDTEVLIQPDEKKITYELALSKPGWHKLNIFAAPREDTTNSLPCVYTYLFFVTKVKEPVVPLPKQFADWSTGCHLEEPKGIDRNGDLDNVKFKVRVPGAKRVAVKAGDEWFHLDKKGDNKWEGKASLRHHIQRGDTVVLNACTGSDETSFGTLLQYTF